MLTTEISEAQRRLFGQNDGGGVMEKYYVNKKAQPNGDHEVHKAGCYNVPSPQNAQHLGQFTNCFGAVAESQKHFRQTNGCAFCCRACHAG